MSFGKCRIVESVLPPGDRLSPQEFQATMDRNGLEQVEVTITDKNRKSQTFPLNRVVNPDCGSTALPPSKGSKGKVPEYRLIREVEVEGKKGNRQVYYLEEKNRVPAGEVISLKYAYVPATEWQRLKDIREGKIKVPKTKGATVAKDNKTPKKPATALAAGGNKPESIRKVGSVEPVVPQPKVEEKRGASPKADISKTEQPKPKSAWDIAFEKRMDALLKQKGNIAPGPNGPSTAYDGYNPYERYNLTRDGKPIEDTPIK